MKCLVIVAHPLSQSLSGHFARQVTERLEKHGHIVVRENLYDRGYNPVLSAKERQSYYGQYDYFQIGDQVEELQNAEALFLIFPTWWFGFPAILKGWFDRVWGPGIAYDHASDFGPIKPRLGDLKHVVAITTLGSPWWVDWLVMWRPVKRNLKYALLGTCAEKCRLDFLSLYKCEDITRERVGKFSKKILEAIDNLPQNSN